MDRQKEREGGREGGRYIYVEREIRARERELE